MTFIFNSFQADEFSQPPDLQNHNRGTSPPGLQLFILPDMILVVVLPPWSGYTFVHLTFSLTGFIDCPRFLCLVSQMCGHPGHFGLIVTVYDLVSLLSNVFMR